MWGQGGKCIRECLAGWRAFHIVFVGLILFCGVEASNGITPAAGQEPLAKPTIAILDVQIGKQIEESATSKRYLDSALIGAELEKSLEQTRKFDVITRDEGALNDVIDEQVFSESGASAGNAALSGEIKAVNYLVRPTVRDFVFYRSHQKVPNVSGKWFRRDSGRLIVDAQVLDTTTAKVTARFSMTGRFATEETIVNNQGGVPSQAHFARMAKAVAADFAEQLVDRVFPMLIIRVQDGQVYINRGTDGGLTRGQVLEVFSKGEELIDPYTGESLGSAEESLGKIRVERVNPKFTIAKIIEEKAPIEQGAIVRRPTK